MGRVAFLFSGQGDQYPGMGKEFLEIPQAAAVFQCCDKLRPGTLEQCMSGSEEELQQTCNTQPCLFAMELAAAAALAAAGVKSDACAGFSLGEVAALCYSGAVDLKTGFSLVCKRAELMQSAADGQNCGMAAVVKLSDEQVQELCGEFQQVYPVNFNSPGQVSVAGATEELPDFFTAVRAAGGKALPLKVKGGFHSPFMAKAAEQFAAGLEQVDFSQPKIPLYSDVTAQPYGDAKQLLAQQIASPVRWTELIRNLIGEGVDTFIEVGPGRTLCNLLKRIDPNVKGYAVCGDWEDILEVCHAEG